MGSTGRRRSAVAAAYLLMGLAAQGVVAADRLAEGSGAERATVVFDGAWAARQRTLDRFADLQRAAGASGAILSSEPAAPFPRVLYGWTGSGGKGRMRAFLYADGAYAAVVSPADGASEITFNSFGAFVCPACRPPVTACGRRPSWIPHDIHWDVFDCEQTLTGPMPERH